MGKVRRSRGEGSIYQRASDGRWCGVVDLGWVAGRRVRRVVTAQTLRELRPKMTALKASIETGVIPDDATVEQWVNHWLADIAPRRVKQRTLDTYAGYVRTWIVPTLGRRKLATLRPEHVRAMHRAMEDAGKSPATVRQAHMILQRALTVAVHERRVAANVATLVDRPATGGGTHGVLSREETAAMLDLLAAYAHDGMWDVASRFLVALCCGLRQGEALGLKWEDIDLTPGSAGMLVVRQIQRQKGAGLVEAPLKTAKTIRHDEGKFIPLIAPVAHALTRWRDASGGVGYVWPGPKGRPRDPRADWGMWKGLLWAAGCDDHPLHAARATTASLLSEAGVPLKVIADILGQSQITTAWRHYIHTDDRQKREGLERGFGGMLIGD